jgi:hypothetical protein
MKEQLPAFVLAELFGDNLVYTGEKFDLVNTKKEVLKTENKAASPTLKKYLGNNERKIAVLVNDDKNMYLSDENLEFLSVILNACQLNLSHIALVNFNNTPLNFIELKEQLQPQYLLSFGIEALQIQLPFAMPDYQVQQYNNCTIVTAPAFQVLNNKTQNAKAEKMKLWKSLQKIFNLEK